MWLRTIREISKASASCRRSWKKLATPTRVLFARLNCASGCLAKKGSSFEEARKNMPMPEHQMACCKNLVCAQFWTSLGPAVSRFGAGPSGCGAQSEGLCSNKGQIEKLGAPRSGIIEHVDPLWASKLIQNGFQSEILAVNENRAWLEAPEVTLFEILSLNVVP